MQHEFLPPIKLSFTFQSTQISVPSIAWNKPTHNTYLSGFFFFSLIYMEWQFNSRNSHVKAKFAYPCTSSCCCLRNTLLVKLVNGATARKSLENRSLEYIAVTSHCNGCQQCQMPRHFSIMEGAKNRRVLCWVNKVDGPFLKWIS
jgi:hypothetical protein